MKIAKNNKLTHTTKVKYVLALKIASDDDVRWLYNKTLKEFNKRFDDEKSYN